MEIAVIGTGSKGNCYKVSDGRTSLLLDCGLPIKRIKESLNFRLSEIEGCLITHEHQDHSKSFKDLMKAGIDIYMSRGTKDALKAKASHRLKIVASKEHLEIGSFQILPFDTQHDSLEPLGFVIQSKVTGEKLLYATDTYYIKYTFKNLTHLMIECNYMPEVLTANMAVGCVDSTLRDRLIESHFSLDNLKDFLRANDLKKVKEIWLIHMSERNCDADIAKKEIQELTGLPVFIA
jgi:phosphoribosyl 1,2-cyclic phosphodiesterase